MSFKCLSAAASLIFCASFAGLTVAHAAEPSVNVRDKGAKCDGTSDDSAAFAAAIAAANPAKGGSGMILVPPSKTPCRLGSPVSLESGETLYAQPDTAVISPIVPHADSGKAPLLISIKDVSNVTVKGLTIDGDIDRVGSSNNLIAVTSADHVVFDHIAVRNARGISISFTGGDKGVKYSGVQNSSFNNTGIYYMKSGDKKADRKQAVAFCCGDKDAAGNYPNQHNFAKSNVWGENGFDNLSFGQQNWFTAEENIFGGTHNGGNIYCSHSNHSRIINNKVRGASGNGIDCFINDDLTIVGNESTMNGAAGIQADGTHCGLIANNRTFNNYQSSVASWSSTHPDVKGSAHRAGITIGGGLKDDTQGTTDLVIANNQSGDTQGRPTQAYGIQIVKKAEISDVQIASDNRLTGNADGALGEQAKGIRLGEATKPACHQWNGQ
jgi:polygalacturonase